MILPVKMSPSPSSAENAPAAATVVVPIIIDGRNIEVTPALEEYVSKRIGGTLNKLSSNGAIRECDVILSVSKNPKVSERKVKERTDDTSSRPMVDRAGLGASVIHSDVTFAHLTTIVQSPIPPLYM